MTIQKSHNSSDASKLNSYFDATNILLDSQLEKLKPAIAELRLKKHIEYVLQTRGKLLRSALVLLSGESVGGNPRDLAKLALAIELLHSASLVHDDILDGDLFRRNTLSIHAKWSVKEAILVGDALASLSLSLCRDYKTEILDVMAKTCLQLSDGEYMDIEQTRLVDSEEDYTERVKKKSASLFKAAAEVGGLASNGPAEEVSALARFGENYGVAFQIRDDVLDADSVRDEMRMDVNELRATLPVIHLFLKRGDAYAEGLLKKLDLAKRKQPFSSDALSELRIELKESGSLTYCATKNNEYIDKAIAALHTCRESPFKNLLFDMAESCRSPG